MIQYVLDTFNKEIPALDGGLSDKLEFQKGLKIHLGDHCEQLHRWECNVHTT